MSGSCTLSLLFLLAALGCKSTSAHPKELVNILLIYEGLSGCDHLPCCFTSSYRQKLWHLAGLATPTSPTAFARRAGSLRTGCS